ncbi:MAG: PASTA domain-containing protein [Paludibacteraceae bacterium]|nr:PASTA domain-containing protein [Paludibacteraceae bacterium]
MNKKGLKEFVKTKFGFVIANLVGAVVVALIALCILFGWLRHYTQHGEEVEVPAITGMLQVEVQERLAEQNLALVVVDSTYSNNVPLGSIVEQTPPAGSHAKKDRSVYVIINASCRRQVEMPDLHDISYRQAQSTLRALGLQIGQTYYEPSEYKDIVLEVRLGDQALEPGDKVEEGSVIAMVVGRGKGTAYVEVPSLQGKSLAEARSLLIDRYHLTVGLIQYDNDELVKEEMIVYQQKPTPGTKVLEGTGIDIKLSNDVEKALISSEDEPEDEDFF